MSYSPINNKSIDDLYNELNHVYIQYAEYRLNMAFYDMVELFSKDDFYNLHLVAKEYIKLLNKIFD
jgi:hypothetical protein